MLNDKHLLCKNEKQNILTLCQVTNLLIQPFIYPIVGMGRCR